MIFEIFWNSNPWVNKVLDTYVKQLSWVLLLLSVLVTHFEEYLKAIRNIHWNKSKQLKTGKWNNQRRKLTFYFKLKQKKSFLLSNWNFFIFESSEWVFFYSIMLCFKFIQLNKQWNNIRILNFEKFVLNMHFKLKETTLVFEKSIFFKTLK